MTADKHILLIISGSIAAYKSLELIRELKTAGHRTTCVMTRSAKHFVTPLSVAALSGSPVYHDMFSLKDETEMGHIRLSREADVVLVAPATADILARIAHGMADDLATTIVLATNKPVLVAPAMNVQMWNHPATMRNIEQLRMDGVRMIAPEAGTLACGDIGEGRMAATPAIMAALAQAWSVSVAC